MASETAIREGGDAWPKDRNHNEANLVDEQRVLEDLEAASDYERGVSRLDTKRKAAWARMKELAGGVKASVAVSMPTTKRKRACLDMSVVSVC
jgi:hypothetical protein